MTASAERCHSLGISVKLPSGALPGWAINRRVCRNEERIDGSNGIRQSEVLTKEMYDKAMNRLQAAGQGEPKGRTFHVCSGSGDKLSVFEVWNSSGDFEAFGAVLMPMSASIRVSPR
jgi:hypothetical protein